VKKFLPFALPALLLLVCFLLIPSLGWPWPAKVVKITDGDTITVLTPTHEQVRIRLYGIDAPERKQPFGGRATEALRDLAGLENVDVLEMARDRYGRTVGIVTTEYGVNLNERMVGDGWAWAYGQYCKSPVCGEWKHLEGLARAEARGLWHDPEPTPPWEWRRARR
jgi:endonuclease YncB( thermonuclease family)